MGGSGQGVGRHEVRVVGKCRHPAEGGIAESVGGAGWWQHGERRTATRPPASSSQAGYRAPRATAASPAMTPPPPRTAAAHSPASVAATGRWPAISTGGAPGGPGLEGTAGLNPAAARTALGKDQAP